MAPYKAIEETNSSNVRILAYSNGFCTTFLDSMNASIILSSSVDLDPSNSIIIFTLITD